MLPLTLRSHYSLMWGTAPVKNLCSHAKNLGYQRLALTDTDNLYGMWEFILACKEQGLDPIIGAEITDPYRPWRAVCLVKNLEGYKNLCQLITRRCRDREFSLRTALPPLGRGMVVLSQSPELLGFWHDTKAHPPLDIAAALPRHPLSGNHPLCRLAKKKAIPLVATPGSFFLNPEDFPLHRMRRAIAGNTCLSRLKPGQMAPTDAFLASPAQYSQRFSTMPEAIENTIKLGEKLEFQGPDFGLVMPPWGSAHHPDRKLREKTLAGAMKRYGPVLSQAVLERIDHELSIISKKQFATYFLVVQDIIKKASRICGRGSGAASIVAYCLGITNVCPIKFNLYFERFLNPGRQDPPDIDIDFAWDERETILDQVLNEFKGRSAMVSSLVRFQPRMALGEVAKVHGLTRAEIKRAVKGLSGFWNTQTMGSSHQAARQKEPGEKRLPRPWPEILTQARALVNSPRHLSVHPGGIVITPVPIDTYVPVETAPKGIPIIQWDKDGAETAGLVKIDLLGNRSLGVVRDAIAEIRRTNGSFTDFEKQDPEEDEATQSLVARGNTMGCFYIESPAMRQLQKKSGKGDFNHLVIHSSIIRPAANEFIRDYLNRLHTEKWRPAHPLLAEVLKETYGIMVFQEDVSRVAVALAGFTPAQADGLRKIMSKKDKDRELNHFKEKFSAGAAQKGVSCREIKKIWKMIKSFSGYSFCKPHSASYARVSFQAAYLKAHYPAQFMAAVISNQGGFYSAFAYVSEARRMGLAVLGPDIRKSKIPWTGSGLVLRVGFLSIKHLSRPTMERIITQRSQSSFIDIEDFFTRVRPREEEARALIHSGCLDGLAKGKKTKKNLRGCLLWAFSAWLQTRAAGSQGLFDGENRGEPRAGKLWELIPDLPPESPDILLKQEFSVLGFLCNTHPILLFKDKIKDCNTVKAADLPLCIGKNIQIRGWPITGKMIKTKQGDPMKFLTFEDETGIIETVFFPGPYARFCKMLEYDRPYFLSGKVADDRGALSLIVDNTLPSGI